MQLSNALDTAVREALLQGIEEMVKDALAQELTPDNAVVVISNDVAPMFNLTVRVLYGAAEVGKLEGYPLVVVSYLKEIRMALISREDLIKQLQEMAG